MAMGTDEKEVQPFVGETFVRGRNGLGFLGELLKNRLGISPDLIAARGVGQAVARGVQQPRFRFLRKAIHGPPLQGRDERVAERVFRAGDVTRAPGQKGDQAAIRIAHDGFNGGVRGSVAHWEDLGFPTAKCDPNSGRTSTENWPASGWRAAHSNALSRFGTSMMPKPARNSFVSA
jgi:hypothetical protein